jgi:molybdopterin molybdotransferase
MMSWQEALPMVLARVPVMGAKESVPFERAAGRILAQPVKARNDTPPFDSSAVDGFGVNPADVAKATPHAPVRLECVRTIQAGQSARMRLRRGMAVKLMTGACVPAGVGGIVMREFCQEEGSVVLVSRAVKAGEHIRPRGGEFRKGQEVLPAGTRVTPPVVGLLATFGLTTVNVYAQPVVAIVVTGDELLPPGERLRPGKIRDCNSYGLRAAARAIGIEDCTAIRVKDHPALLQQRLGSALRRANVLLTVGGVSVGDYDYVRPVLEALGVRQVFWRVAVKPGKPAYFGIFDQARRSGAARGRQCFVFGLPGNPVSALVGFHQMVKPALLKMMGMTGGPPLTLRARLAGARHKEAGRMEWVRGVLQTRADQLVVRPTAGADSHMLGGLARANCLVRLPRAASYVADGEVVIVEPLKWYE